MSRSSFLLWFISIVILLGLVNCYSNLKGNNPSLSFNTNTKQNEPIEISINTNQSSSIEKGILGFNTNVFEGSYKYLDAEFVENTSLLKPQTLRFPGGTVANFYHWEREGFIEQELISTANSNLNNRNVRNYRRLQERSSGKISFNDFMKLCNQLNVKPIVVVNLFTGSPTESAAWVRYVKEHSYEVYGWELGNDFWLPSYRKKFPTANEYIKVAKKHAEAMKAVDPTIKVAVTAAPAGFHPDSQDEQAKYERLWNEKLGNEKFFDAYTIHMYTYFKGTNRANLETLRGRTFASTETELTSALSSYPNLFDKSKKMWVTEWNFSNPGNSIMNTQLHAMYAGDFFLGLLNAPNIVSQATYHVLSGSGTGFPVFSPPTSGDSVEDGSTARRTVYYPFKLVGDTLAKSNLKYDFSLKNIPMLQVQPRNQEKMIPGVRAVAVGKSGKIFVMISNRTSLDTSTILVVNGKQISGRVRYLYVANDRLEATNGGNSVIPNSGTMEVGIREWLGTASKLQVPKNSFGVIEIL